jgi:hypothetical protein
VPAPLLVAAAAVAFLQLVVQLARDEDKDGRRTIGVLTKAEMIEPGTHDTWLPVLQVGRCCSWCRHSLHAACHAEWHSVARCSCWYCMIVVDV